MSTRYRLENPRPLTRLTVGQWYGDTHWAGISVHTTEHVRFFASGTDITKSDLVAQAVGQVWLQSVQKMVGFADKDLLIASHQATNLVAEGGVTILSGFGPGPITSETTPGTFPPGIDSYEAKAAIASGIWVIFDTFMAITITAVSAALTLKDGSMDAWAYEGAAANLAGASVNLAGLSFIPWSENVSLPGINLFSQAGTLVGAAFGSVNVIGLPGALIASTFTTQFGLLTAGVRGFYSAGMNALGPVDVTALGDVTCRAYKGATFGARLGATTVKGVDMTVGTKPGAVLPQQPTDELSLAALAEVAVETPLDLTLSAMTQVKTTAGTDTQLKAATEVELTCGGFKISILGPRVYMGQAGGPGFGISDNDVMLKGPGSTAKGIVADGKVELGLATATIKVVPGTSLTVDGQKFDLQ